MAVTASDLREIHQLHRRASDLRQQIDRGPRQVAARRNLLADRTQSLEKARTDLKAIKVATHQKDTDRKGLEARINQLQLQINTAKTNKEYSTLVSEKDTAVKARTAAEDEALEIMLREDEKAKEIQILESEVKRLEHELIDLERTVNQQSASLASELGEVEARLKSMETTLPNEMADAYQRVVIRRGPDGLAHVENGTCTGCYTGITPQMHNQLLMSELVMCKSCGRILYLEHIPAEVIGE